MSHCIRVLRLAFGVLVLSSLSSFLGSFVAASTHLVSPSFTQCHLDVCGPGSQNPAEDEDEDEEDPKLSVAVKTKIRKVAEQVYDAYARYLDALPALIANKTSSTEAERIGTSLQIAMVEFLKPQDLMGFTSRINDLNYSSIPGIGAYSFSMSRDEDFKNLLFGVQAEAEKLTHSAPSLKTFRGVIDALLIQLEKPENLPYYTTISPAYRAILRTIRASNSPTREEIFEVYYIRAAIQLIEAGRTPGPIRQKLLVYDLFGEIRHREQFQASLAKYAADAKKPELKAKFVESVLENCSPSFDIARKISPSALKTLSFPKIEKEAKAAVLDAVTPFLTPELRGHVANAIAKTKVQWPLTFKEYQTLLLNRLELEAKVANDKTAPDPSLTIDGIIGMNLTTLLGVCEQYAVGEDYTDQTLLTDRSIMISPKSVQDGNAFDNLAHELGHQVELELKLRMGLDHSPFSATPELGQVSNCLMLQHFNANELNDRFLSEDFADFVAARAGIKNRNHLCKVHPFNEWNHLTHPLVQSDQQEDHSGPLFRILQVEVFRQGNLPNSCVAYAKSTGKEFRDCAKFAR